MKITMRNLILITLIALTLVTVGSMTFLEEYFYRTRLRVPDPQTGRIYVQNVKSTRGVTQVYLTRTENMPFDYVRYVSPVLCLAIFVTAVVLIWKKRRASKS